jgi:DNA gyrase/topoisomerase IV subunit B
MAKSKKEIIYDEKTIQTLDALEHIRLRTGMYIGRIGDGSNPADGIYVMLKEVIDNAVDEFIMGHGKRVLIKRHGPEVSVRDYGRGIPLGKVIDCVSKINTGGKYNDDVFQFSVGLNGVGNKAVNALSSEFEVISYRDGKFKRGLFSQGKKREEKGGKKAKERNGTFIRFIPAPEIFEDYGWQEEYLEHRLRYYAFLNSGLILDYNGEKYVSKNGLADLLAYELGGEPTVYDAFHCKLDRLEFAFSHTHGVNEFAKNGFAGEDVRDGLVGAVAVKVQDPVFESQTKNKLGSTEVRSWVVNSVKDQVVLWLHKYPKEAEKLLEKVKNNQRVRKELSAIKKEAKERAKKVAIRIPKLIDCKVHLSDDKGKRREETTIFLTEGDSAGGAMIQARDVQTQAIYSLKGKPLNTHGLGREAVYKNEELYNIMRALGIEEDLEGLRYNKVVIATDADVDGMHIRNLLLTYFLRFFEELVFSGHVYILETPIFRVRNKKETVYCYSEAERDEAAERLRNHEVTRFKGLGEISPAEFKQFIADDDHMKRITTGSMGDVKRALDFYMGKNTPARKEYIIENLIADIA